MNWCRDLAEVPAFPPVTMKLLRALSEEPVDLRELADLVSADPGLSALVMSYANSALFGGDREVSSVLEALVRLGTDSTREVIVTLATKVCFRTAGEVEEIARCWRHTLATAIIADEIARAAGRFQSQAYTAALLHDLGRLVLAAAYRDQYVKLIQKSAQKCMDLLDHETALFGVNHTTAGCWLVQEWQLPEELRIIAGRHHDAPENLDLTLLLIVHVACLLADAIGYDVCPAPLPISFEEAVQRLPMQVDAQFLWTGESLRARVDERLKQFAGTTEPLPKSEEVQEPEVRTETAPDAIDSNPWVLLLAVTVVGSLLVLYWPR